MTIATNNTILRSEVVSAYNNHVQNVINLIQKNASTGVVYASQQPVSNNSSTPSSYLTGQSAIPTGQLDSTTPTKITESQLNAIPSASQLYTLLISACNTMTKIRKCKYQWMHNNYQTGRIVAEELNYYTNLLNVTSAVSGTTEPYYTKNPNTTQTTADIATSVPHTGIQAENVMTASDVTTYLQALYDKWKSWCDSNVITYQYYTCHFNCHSNYDDRARR